MFCHRAQCQWCSSCRKAALLAVCCLECDLECAFLSRRPHLLWFVYTFTVYYFPGLFEFLPVCQRRCCLIIVILIISSHPFPGLQCSENRIFAAFDKFIRHKALKMLVMKACSGNSAWRVCQTSTPRACPDGILMPGLLNYSEGWGSPVKTNVCLRAVSFSCLVRRRCSFHLQPLADAEVARGWRLCVRLQRLARWNSLWLHLWWDHCFSCRVGRGGQQTEGDRGHCCGTHVTASTPHWGPRPGWPLPR